MWRVYSLPAMIETEADKDYRTEIGDVLMPKRFPRERLEKIKASDPGVWEANYQQRPRIGGGFWFQTSWLNFYPKPLDPVRENMNVYGVCDSSLGKNAKSDHTAIFYFATGQDENYYWLDLLHARLDTDKRVDEMFRMHRQWRPRNFGYEEIGMQTDIEQIKRRQEKVGYRFPITELGRKGIWHNHSKPDRIRTLVPVAKTGHLWLPDPRSTAFPQVTRDMVLDFIDKGWSKYPGGKKYIDVLDVMSRMNDPAMNVRMPSPRAPMDEAPQRSFGADSWMLG